MIETAAGPESVEAMAATPGPDGVFISPADLSACLTDLAHVDYDETLELASALLAEAPPPSSAHAGQARTCSPRP